MLPVTEGAAELTANKEEIRKRAERAKRKLVFELVDETCASDVGAIGSGVGLRAEAVTVTPGFERTAMLDVAEVIVPGELGDLGIPGKANGREGEDAEGDGHPGASAGDNSGQMRDARGAWRRRSE